MKVHVQLQGRTETLHEGDGATRQLVTVHPLDRMTDPPKAAGVI
jgi:hypothetical protein